MINILLFCHKEPRNVKFAGLFVAFVFRIFVS